MNHYFDYFFSFNRLLEENPYDIVENVEAMHLHVKPELKDIQSVNNLLQ